MITAGWVILVLFAFGFGVLTGLYLGSHSAGTAKHRQPVNPRPVLMPPAQVEDTPTKLYVDKPWDLSPEDLEQFEKDLERVIREGDPSRLQFLREHFDTHSTAERMERGHWEEAVASWRATAAEPIDFGLTEEEKQKPLDPGFVEAMHDPLLPQRLQEDPEYINKMRHWEGLSGSLEPEPEPKILRPEETSSSLLGLSGGAIRPTAGVKPVFGETEHLEYDPEDYEEPLICQPCKRALVKGETFWAVSLPEEGEGVFIPICDECEAKSHG